MREIYRKSFIFCFGLFLVATITLATQNVIAASKMCDDVKRIYERNINMCNGLINMRPEQMDEQKMGFARWCANQRGYLRVCEKEATALLYGNLYDAGNNVIGSFMHVHGENGTPRYILSKQLPRDGVSVINAEPLRKGTVPVPYCGYPAYEYGYVETVYFADNRTYVASRGTLYLSADPNTASNNFKGFLMPAEANGMILHNQRLESNCSNANVHITFEKTGGTGGRKCISKGYNPYGCGL